MKKRILLILISVTLLFFASNRAFAELFPFVNISNNSGIAATLAEQFFVDVTSPGSGQVQFDFLNDGLYVSSPIDSVITRIYWDDGPGLLGNIDNIGGGPGVWFDELSPPLNFPEGNTIGFNENVGLKAHAPAPTFGIGVGESLAVLFDINTANGDFDDIIAAMYNLDMRIGIHVQSIGGDDGPSDSFASVPEPATMLLLGSGLIGFAVVGRRKFFSK
jgi:hypothetical protein